MTRRAFDGAVLLIIGILGLGLALWFRSMEEGWGEPVGLKPSYNIFYALYEGNEPSALGLSLLVLLSAWAAAFLAGRLGSGSDAGDLAPSGSTGAGSQAKILVLAAATLGVCWLGSHWAYQRHPFSMDEFGAEMQARIFASGQLTAPVPESWHPYHRGVTPIFVTFTEDGHWVSQYLPVYALMRAATLTLHPSMLLNPLLAAFSLWCVAGLARRLFPDVAQAGWVAALLLAGSSQFLVEGMSFYSMPAHLALNLLWLHLYLRDDRTGWILLTAVGVLAMGLHQFVMHGLFAAPFLFRLVLRRRWLLSFGVASGYLSGLAAWTAWVQWSRPLLERTGGLASGVGLPGWRQWLDQAMGLVLLTTWQGPALMVTAFVGLTVLASRLLADRKTVSPVVIDLALSCLLTFGVYLLILPNQGHGWGNRYFSPVLGNWVLLGVLGWGGMVRGLGRRPAWTFLAVAWLGSVACLLPLRWIQVTGWIAPFQQASAYLRGLDAEVVLIDPWPNWYSWDLVRSDPLFERGPVVMDLRKMRPDQHQDFHDRPGALWVRPEVLTEQGLTPVRRRTP